MSTDEKFELVPDVSMKDFTKMLDEAWPKGMPPEKLEVCISGPDQVVHTVEKVTLELLDNQETVVIHWKEEVDEDDVGDVLEDGEGSVALRGDDSSRGTGK